MTSAPTCTWADMQLCSHPRTCASAPAHAYASPEPPLPVRLDSWEQRFLNLSARCHHFLETLWIRLPERGLARTHTHRCREWSYWPRVHSSLVPNTQKGCSLRGGEVTSKKGRRGWQLHVGSCTFLYCLDRLQQRFTKAP